MSLSLGAYNIFTDAWLNEFFPEDLPADWRIEYYSNEFDLLHLPASLWDDAEFNLLEMTLPDEMTGILEVTQPLTQHQRWAEVTAWAEQQNTILAVGEGAAQCSEKTRQFTIGEDCGTAMSAVSDNLQLLRLQPKPFNLKQMRAELEKLLHTDHDEALVILDGTPAQLDQTRTLIELMGL